MKSKIKKINAKNILKLSALCLTFSASNLMAQCVTPTQSGNQITFQEGSTIATFTQNSNSTDIQLAFTDLFGGTRDDFKLSNQSKKLIAIEYLQFVADPETGSVATSSLVAAINFKNSENNTNFVGLLLRDGLNPEQVNISYVETSDLNLTVNCVSVNLPTGQSVSESVGIASIDSDITKNFTIDPTTGLQIIAEYNNRVQQIINEQGINQSLSNQITNLISTRDSLSQQNLTLKNQLNLCEQEMQHTLAKPNANKAIRRAIAVALTQKADFTKRQLRDLKKVRRLLKNYRLVKIAK